MNIFRTLLLAFAALLALPLSAFAHPGAAHQHSSAEVLIVAGVVLLAAVLVGLFNWGNMFAGVLPLNIGGIDVVLNNPCHDSFTYRLGFGGIVTPIGTGVSPVMLIGYILYCTTQLTLFLSLIGFA